MPRYDSRHRHVAAGDRAGHQQRGRFDAVGNQPPSAAAKLLDAVDFQDRRAESHDSRPQCIQHRAKIDDLRLLSGVAYDRPAAGEHRRREDIGRARNGRAVRAEQVDIGAAESPRRGNYAAVFQAQVRAQCRQTAEVQIDWAVADIASARQRHDRSAPPCQQRSKHAKARSQAADHVVSGLDDAAVNSCQHQSLGVVRDRPVPSGRATAPSSAHRSVAARSATRRDHRQGSPPPSSAAQRSWPR